MTDKELIRLYKKGMYIDDIAKKAGTTRGTINNRLVKLRKARKVGRRTMKGRRRPTHAKLVTGNERRVMVKTLRLGGATNEEIAETLSISKIRVSQIVAELVEAGEVEPRINRFQ